MAVISIGDGRYIEHQEGALRLPPRSPKKPAKSRWGVEGQQEWHTARVAQTATLTFASQLTKLPKVPGMDREEADALWADAQRRATNDMENIKKELDLPAAAAEALEATLNTMRAPITQAIKLTAARTILEYTMSKPTAKSDVTINAAEKWLTEIGGE